MKVLVTGATGVIGRQLLPLLRESGHHVVAVLRDEHESAQGPFDEVVVGDLLDAPRLSREFLRVRPDVVVHQATSLPKRLASEDAWAAFAANDRLRVEGTAAVVAAAVAAGVKRIVAQSIAFAYAPMGPMVVPESAPLFLDAPPPWGASVSAVAALEHAVLTAPVEGVVLRYGSLYGRGTWWDAGGDLTEDVRQGRSTVIGDGAGVTSFVHVSDAAVAAAVAVDGGEGVYNVVDDDPAPMATILDTLARSLGAPAPGRIDVEEALAREGWLAVHRHTEQRGASSDRAHRDLRLPLKYPSWRQHLGTSD